MKEQDEQSKATATGVNKALRSGGKHSMTLVARGEAKSATNQLIRNFILEGSGRKPPAPETPEPGNLSNTRLKLRMASLSEKDLIEQLKTVAPNDRIRPYLIWEATRRQKRIDASKEKSDG